MQLDVVAWSLYVAAALAAAVCAGYAYMTRHHGKWRTLSVPHTRPTALFGNIGDTVLGRAPLMDVMNALYRRFDGHRYFGVYEVRQPVLVVRDPALVHAVLVRDSGWFRDRVASNVSFVHDRLFEHLVNMRGDRWKAVRAKLGPTFTAAKLKAMMSDIHVCAARLTDHLDCQVDADLGQGVVNVNEAAARFTTDTIGRCAFGLDCNALSDQDSEYRRAGLSALTATRRTVALNLVRLTGLGWLLDVFRVSTANEHVCRFFDGLFQDAVRQHGTGEAARRNDFIALLVKLKRDEDQTDPEERLFTDNILVANAFVFFIAGFETTASTISYCLYELAMNRKIQDELREKIKKTLDANNGELSYDVLKDMKYLDMIINETFRLHPPVPTLTRVCTKKYTIPDSDLVMNVGDKLYIPTYSLHYDPEYYPEPEVFDPDRFSDENKASRLQGTFLPFGDGPRICIGMRFALMEVRIGLAEILTKFEVMPCKDTVTHIKIKPRSILLTPKEPIRLKFKKIIQS